MDLRGMSTERLLGVTARLLAASAVLVVVGLALVTWSGWRQIGQSYGPDGTPPTGEMPLSARVAIAVFESSFRPAGLQLTVAAVLVAGAVVALQLHPGRPHLGSLRWEVLGAGSAVLFVAVVFVSAHAFVITAPDSVDGDVSNYIGLQPMTEAALINLLPMGAALLTLVAAALWWRTLGRATDDDVEEESTDEDDPSEDDTSEDAEDAEPVHERRRTPVARDASTGAPAVDYSRDWSPEDFRPPR